MKAAAGSVRRRAGQVIVLFMLLIAVLVFMLLLNVDLFFAFTRKNQMQNAGDAAALAAAVEQGRALNRIGELNFRRIEALLEFNPVAADVMLMEQIETALSWPVSRAFAAAQDAAKENHVYVDRTQEAILRERLAALRERMGYLSDEDKARLSIYIVALENMLSVSGGIAAGADNMSLFDFLADGHLLYQQAFYDAILSREWCWFKFFAMHILESYRTWHDWSPLPVNDGEIHFADSEIFPLHVRLRTGGVLQNVGAEDLIEYMHSAGFAHGFTALDLATNDCVRTYENGFYYFSRSHWAGWDELYGIDDFMTGSVKPEYDVAGCSAMVRVSGRLEPSSPSTSGGDVVWTAAAKPFGCLEKSNGEREKITACGWLVVPGFTDARLVPLDAVEEGTLGCTADIAWMRHVYRHLPDYMQGGPGAVSASCKWCGALKTWERESFRRQGLHWLEIYGKSCRIVHGSGGGRNSGRARHGH